MKYEIYIRILDRICEDAPSKNARYHPAPTDIEKVNQARARASIHLYLKVLFGMLDFKEREYFVTDGTFDGGIDAYYIDSDTKTIYLVQAKFRATEKNYENKEIKLSELLNMDINRILGGEPKDENGNDYNGKIRQLQRDISELTDIARYHYRVVVLANLTSVSDPKLRQLTGGYAVEIFNHERTYRELVFPVITGTYFTASDICIPIDLSNKNAGSKISYTVTTKVSDCEITVLFVPTIELAKVMLKYKNSILKYNPRSYLDFEGKFVNQAIRNTILNLHTNEFALFNNGITMLSDETFINERIGQKNRAQLIVKNPQIINGGQTAFTLSRLYNDNINNEPESIFEGKEVLVKIITLLDTNTDGEKLQLIDEISNATNKQTPVINADKFANENFHIAIQKKMYEKYGILFERKRGEFSDGLNNGYLDNSIVVERNQFFRIFYASNANVTKGTQKKLFQKNKFEDISLTDDNLFDRFYIGLYAFKELVRDQRPTRIDKDIYGKLFAYILMFEYQGLILDPKLVRRNLSKLNEKWTQFMVYASKNSKVGRRNYVDHETGKINKRFVYNKFLRSNEFQKAIVSFFGNSA